MKHLAKHRSDLAKRPTAGKKLAEYEALDARRGELDAASRDAGAAARVVAAADARLDAATARLAAADLALGAAVAAAATAAAGAAAAGRGAARARRRAAAPAAPDDVDDAFAAECEADGRAAALRGALRVVADERPGAAATAVLLGRFGSDLPPAAKAVAARCAGADARARADAALLAAELRAISLPGGGGGDDVRRAAGERRAASLAAARAALDVRRCAAAVAGTRAAPAVVCATPELLDKLGLLHERTYDCVFVDEGSQFPNGGLALDLCAALSLIHI